MGDLKDRDCIMRDQIGILSKRADRMETALENTNTKISILDNKIVAMGERDNFLERILSRMEISYNEVKSAYRENTKVISEMRETMIGMQSDIKMNAATTTRIEKDLGEIKVQFEESEEKAKIDLRDVIKQVIENKMVQILGMLVGLGLFAWLITNANWENFLLLLGK